jgi:hypothetical protein
MGRQYAAQSGDALLEKKASYRSAARVRQLQIAERRNSAEAETIAWQSGAPVNQEWLVRVSVPFTYDASKNSRHSLSKSGLFTRKAFVQFRTALALTLKSALARQGIKPVDGKLWLDLFVQKSNHRGDAVNVVEAICDAVQDATGVNDRWYSIKRLDWQVVHRDPMIFVGVSQETTVPQSMCSCCGLIRPDTEMHTSRGLRSKTRICVACRAPSLATP